MSFSFLDFGSKVPKWGFLMESRAPLEKAGSLILQTQAHRLPRANGEPVIVYPGFLTSDLATESYRNFLTKQGFTVYGWEMGTNKGPSDRLLDQMMVRLSAIEEHHGQNVHLIGWSLGGVFAREIAKRHLLMGKSIASVLTMGTPILGQATVSPMWPLYEWVTGTNAHDSEALHLGIHEAPGCPLTAIYSKSDAIVPWYMSMQLPQYASESPRISNIIVESSHIGLPRNPWVWYATVQQLLRAQSISKNKVLSKEDSLGWGFSTPTSAEVKSVYRWSRAQHQMANTLKAVHAKTGSKTPKK